MTITLDINPEVGSELVRRAEIEGRTIEAVASSLLEGAVHPGTVNPEHRTGQAIVDAFAENRGLLSDDEIDRMFRRNPSAARPLDLS